MDEHGLRGGYVGIIEEHPAATTLVAWADRHAVPATDKKQAGDWPTSAPKLEI
jgi:hypothetical protein